MLGQRWLLIGDQNQLPPYMYEKMKEHAVDIVDEDDKRDDELKIDTREKVVKEIKFFEKLYEDFKSVSVIHSKENYLPCTMLNTQWRLPPKISDLISTTFYDTKFIPKKEDPKENDPFVNPNYLSKEQLIWIDIPQGNKNNDFTEQRTTEGSYYNKGEIQTLLDFIRKLELNPNVKKNDLEMVILTPYIAQRDEIKRELIKYRDKNIDTKKLARSCFTVDSYQGRQADIVIISLVRNNMKPNIRSALGFLSSPERLNVTFSRVKKRMIIFGCSRLIKKFAGHEDGEKINQIFDFIKSNGKFTSNI
jgi:superfamily I DNA and/or RNA helicase